MPNLVMVLVAHPDDEYAFAHNLIRSEMSCGNVVHVICATTPCESRAIEFQNSCRVFGIPSSNYKMLGIPDAEGSVDAVDVVEKAAPFLHTWIKSHHLAQDEKVVLYTHNPVGEYGHPHHRECSKAGRLLASLRVVNELWYFAYNFKKADIVFSDESKPQSECRKVYAREAYILDHFDLINEGFIRAN